MASGLTNAPKIVRGAFVEYGLSIPPLFVVFQFNPVELTRSRSLSFAPENESSGVTTPTTTAVQTQTSGQLTTSGSTTGRSIRDWHKEMDDLLDIQSRQKVTVQEETINFDIRLDATDELSEGNLIAAGFGVAPRLATLELMVHPKEESLLAEALGSLLGSEEGFSFTKKPNPPMVLFIWGLKRVLPVNINSLSIKESEFSPMLDPIRATVTVNLTVIEGGDPFYTYSKVMKEVSSLLNLANIAEIANIVIPG